MERWDVILVGSGISSLTSAVLLGKRGYTVLVLERHTKPGGYLHCFNRFRHRFDTGGHYVGAMERGQPFHSILGYLGVYDSELFVPLKSDGFDVFRFPSFEVSFCKGYPSTIEAVCQIFPTERKAIQTYFEKIQQVCLNFPTYEFDERIPIMRTLKALETPLTEVVEGLTSNKKLQCVFYGYCSLHGVLPPDVSFGFHALVTDSFIRGPYGFKRGGDSLTEQFVKKIESYGGQVVTNVEVTKLSVVDKKIHCVETSTGDRYQADWIISGAHPKATFQLLNEDPSPPAFKHRMKEIEETIAIFGVYGTYRKPPPLDPLRNYYFFRGEDPETLFEVGEASEIPAVVYVTRPDRGSGVGPQYPLTFHAPGPYRWFEDWGSSRFKARPEAYRTLKQSVARCIIGSVEAQVPGLAELLERFDASTPLTNLHYNGSEDGAAYGIYHSIRNTGARAIGPRTRVKNLLLTGQNCMFPGLLGASISGIRSAGEILGLKPLIAELRRFKERGRIE